MAGCMFFTPLALAETNFFVTLSGMTASPPEAVMTSKGPYPRHGYAAETRLANNLSAPSQQAAVELLGVLRLHKPIRERIGLFCSG